MRVAQKLLEVHGRSVRVRYTPDEDMTAAGAGVDHQTACILYK
jgi:hypothetical protein